MVKKKNLDLLQNAGYFKFAIEKVLFYPPPPQGGLYNLLDFNKSPLRLRLAASAVGRRSRPTADEDGGARLGDLGVFQFYLQQVTFNS